MSSGVFRIGRESCYWNPAQAIPGLYKRDGYTNENTIFENAVQNCAPNNFMGRGQTEPFHNEQNPVWIAFYSDQNFQYIQSELRRRGFNPAPSRNDVATIMDRAFEARAPYGTFGAFLTCDVTNRPTEQYNREWLQMLNKAVINEIAVNLGVHRWAMQNYLREISYFKAPNELAQPESETQDIRKGGSVLLDRQLPSEDQLYSYV